MCSHYSKHLNSNSYYMYNNIFYWWFCSSTPWYIGFIFGIPLQADILQLHFHNSSPFETYPVNMWTFICVVFIYCITLACYIKNWLTGSRRYKSICDKVGYISGFLTLAAFISMLIPLSFAPLVFAIWIVVSIMVIDLVRNWILELAGRLYNFFKDKVSLVQNILKSTIEANREGATTMGMYSLWQTVLV